MAEQIKMLFGANTPEDPQNIVLDMGPDPPTDIGRGPNTPHISGMTEARDQKF